MLKKASVTDKPKHLVILGINDTHGYAWPYDGSKNAKIGGFARIAAVLNEIRNEAEINNWDLLFLHAGDVTIGMPESDLFNAEPDIFALNMMKLDAMTIGNHEFDNPMSVISKQIKIAKFPIISANIKYKTTDKNFLTPYIIKKFTDIKVAILGLTTKTTEYTANPVTVKDLYFASPSDVAKDYIPQLKKAIGNEGIIVVLGHLGIIGFEEKSCDCDGRNGVVQQIKQNDKADDPYGGSVSLAQSIRGIDIIIDGHTHTLVTSPIKINDTLIIQAGAYSRYLSRIDLTILNGKIIDYEYKIIPVDEKVNSDVDVQNLLDPYYKQSIIKLNEVVGYSSINFENTDDATRKHDTLIGHLVTDAMMWKTSMTEDVQAALINGGRIRAGLSAGKISYRDLLRILPFGDRIVILKIKGSDLLEAIKWGGVFHPRNSGARLNSCGLNYTIEADGIKNILINGNEIEPDSMYTIAVNDYIANGGDNYLM
ncbi:MAG: 5'-nucleotidase C-terminal domain-containing protein, partial [Candidatus Nanoarchaeia archaeon]|nr:5'-nucleotidase C-terminal domain-containing protein [Candidatus Jingweiarchaeum tengchongense]